MKQSSILYRKKFRIFTFVLPALILSSVSSYAANRQFYEQYERIRVSGPSMLPTLKSGETTIAYKNYPYRSLRLSDIVVIDSERGFSVIHRIFRRYRGGLWLTKGDYNRRADRELLGADNFRGLALVDPSSIKRFRKYTQKKNKTIPVDVEKYMNGRTK